MWRSHLPIMYDTDDGLSRRLYIALKTEMRRRDRAMIKRLLSPMVVNWGTTADLHRADYPADGPRAWHAAPTDRTAMHLYYCQYRPAKQQYGRLTDTAIRAWAYVEMSAIVPNTADEACSIHVQHCSENNRTTL